MNNAIGKLFLIPNTLGDISPQDVMSHSIRDAIHTTQYFIFEKEKVGRAYIKRWCPEKSQNEIDVQILNKHTSQQELLQMLSPCLSGNNMALITDAGCPGIADPGADLVLLAHQSKVHVQPLVGPSSILLALMGSGLNGNYLHSMDIFRLTNRHVNKPSKILNESHRKTTKPRFL
jgi:16S rRNA (cytidine1402-2'-O)-methyltransferase